VSPDAVECLLVLHRGNVAEWLQEAVVLEPPDPLEDRELHVFQAAPRATTPDHLRLGQPDHRFGQRVGVRVAPAAHGGLDTNIGEPLRVAIKTYCPGSTGRRNTASASRVEELVQCLGRCFPAQSLTRSGVERQGHGIQFGLAVRAQVCALRKVLPQKSIRVLVRAALPRATRIAEADFDSGVDPQPCMLRHLGPLIPRQRAPESLGQGPYRLGSGVSHRLSAMPGQRGPVSLTLPRGMPLHSWEVEQERKSCRAFHQGADGGTA
jgi:hypothetical protein